MGQEVSTTTQETEFSDLSSSELWQNIGFHRPLSGYFYNIPILIISIVISVGIAGTFFRYIYPFPESLGYKTAVSGIFILFFEIFDLGTANIVNRFIGEYAIKDQQRMVKYIQYFIWYQMITGLLQTTLISIYALFIVPKSELAYTVWIMILISTTQYPGMLGIFKATLTALQQFDKEVLLSFFSTNIFERVTEVGLILIGRAWGKANPMIGELMGVAIFASIARYVDDFFATLVAARFLNKILKPYNITVGQCFRPDFDWKIVRECSMWGLKSGLPSLLTPIVSLIELTLWLSFIPQYSTFISLASIARNFSGLVGQRVKLGGGIAESYLNGKPHLAKFYVSQAIRYSSLFQFMMIPLVVGSVLVLEPILLDVVHVPYFLGIIGFIFPQAITAFFSSYTRLSTDVVMGTGKVNVVLFGKILEAAVGTVSMYLVIAVFQVQSLGLWVIPYVLYWSRYPGEISQAILYYGYINRTAFRIRIPWHQAIVAPGLAALIQIGFSLLSYLFIFLPAQLRFGTLVGVILYGVVCMLLAPFLIYFPLTAVLGAWDDHALDILQKARKISGPGKLLVVPLYNIVHFFAMRSKLHNRYQLDESQAQKEAKELMELRNQNAVEKVRIMK